MYFTDYLAKLKRAWATPSERANLTKIEEAKLEEERKVAEKNAELQRQQQRKDAIGLTPTLTPNLTLNPIARHNPQPNPHIDSPSP
jgi:hypothetical protein